MHLQKKAEGRLREVTFYVSNTSDFRKYEIMEFDSIEQCLETLLPQHPDGPGGEFILSKYIESENWRSYGKKVDWNVEIYDTYRE